MLVTSSLATSMNSARSLLTPLALASMDNASTTLAMRACFSAAARYSCAAPLPSLVTAAVPSRIWFFSTPAAASSIAALAVTRAETSTTSSCRSSS